MSQQENTPKKVSEIKEILNLEILPFGADLPVSHYGQFFTSPCFPVFKGYNPFPPTSNQEIISPYNINTLSSIEVTRIKENIN